MKRFLSVLFICTIVEALQNIRPGAEWSLRGDDYADLNWLDKTQTKPTRTQITTAIADCKTDEAAREISKRTARVIVRTSTATVTQKVNALLLLLDLDK